MSDLTIGLLGALLATNQPLAVSNLVQQQTGVSVAIVNPNDPAEQRRVLAAALDVLADSSLSAPALRDYPVLG